jgi:hypothetical protein
MYWASGLPKHCPSVTSWYSPSSLYVSASPPNSELETTGVPSESLATWLCQRLLRKALVKSSVEKVSNGQDAVCETDVEADLSKSFHELRNARLRSLLAGRDVRKRLELLLTFDTGMRTEVGPFVCVFCSCEHACIYQCLYCTWISALVFCVSCCHTGMHFMYVHSLFPTR